MGSKSLLMAAACLALSAAPQERPPVKADAPIACSACAEWNAPREPFRVFGNTYYVGVGGLSSVLIASDEGHVLLDGALPQSAPQIAASIGALGFDVRDIRLIAASHEHFDHVGGIAALQRATGAVVVSSHAGARALQQGEPTPEDPQYAFGRAANGYPPVATVRVVEDGETLRVGGIALTAHLTPGHTPGSTTWTWRSCEGTRCLDMVYADSLNPVSAPGFRFSRDLARVDAFRASIAKVRALPCDVLLAVHPGFADLDGKRRRRQEGMQPDPFIDRGACRAYADAASASLARRLQGER